MKRTPILRRTPLRRGNPTHKAGHSTLKSGGSRAGRKRKKRASAAEKEYMGRVAEQGCLICSLHFRLHHVPAEVHHLKYGGGSLRASHWDTMPLCPEHHRGDTGIHMLGQEGFEAAYGVSELKLLQWFQEYMRTDELRAAADKKEAERGG